MSDSIQPRFTLPATRPSRLTPPASAERTIHMYSHVPSETASHQEHMMITSDANTASIYLRQNVLTTLLVAATLVVGSPSNALAQTSGLLVADTSTDSV